MAARVEVPAHHSNAAVPRRRSSLRSLLKSLSSSISITPCLSINRRANFILDRECLSKQSRRIRASLSILSRVSRNRSVGVFPGSWSNPTRSRFRRSRCRSRHSGTRAEYFFQSDSVIAKLNLGVPGCLERLKHSPSSCPVFPGWQGGRSQRGRKEALNQALLHAAPQERVR